MAEQRHKKLSKKHTNCNIFKKFLQENNLQFNNEKILVQAFTHSSYVNEHRNNVLVNNERLEFLGDAVLELIVSQYLYVSYPTMSEGELSKLRAAIVCEPSLSQLANELSFGKLLLLGKGEENTGGRSRPSILADVFEAFIGALYLDQGLEKTTLFLQNFLFPKIDAGAFSHMMDFKTQLQEFIQRKQSGTISYEVLKEKGPAHNREFKCEVLLNNVQIGVGKGRTKKTAEQNAAQVALKSLKK